jgi:uncharacterized protein YgbK (DUF1537 family)
MTDMLLAFYGDDFSGSSDVLEVLAAAGVPTILFLRPPSAAQLARFLGIRAVGIAGLSRSLPTEKLEGELRPAFAALAKLAPTIHYKVCSTFDSSPNVGSIGKVIDIARDMFQPAYVPVVVGAPPLGRYCVFGHLFARSGSDGNIYRLDRHPTMARHPVTPMDEADLTALLARQTKARAVSLDWLNLSEGRRDQLVAGGADILVIDLFAEKQFSVVGRLVLDGAQGGRTRFAVGSTGLNFAMTAHWRATGQIPERTLVADFVGSHPVVAVSGSCSPVTEAQIAHAVRCGFGEVRLQPDDWTRGYADNAVTHSQRLLKSGRNVIVHAASGPSDPRIAQARSRLEANGGTGQRDTLLGEVLAKVVETAVNETGVRRIAVAGGDTSGHVTSKLGVEALEYLAPLAPGSPLCRIIARDSILDGVEVTFKGGQVGAADFFVRLAHGTRATVTAGH